MNLTAKQHEIIALIWNYRKHHGIAPTLAELAEKLSVSKITVHEHISLLEKKKALTKEKYQSRSLRLSKRMERELEAVELENSRGPRPLDQRGSSLPLLGRIAAGVPIDAVEDHEEIDLHDLVPMDRASYLLTVKGNSMIKAGIHDGDYVVVEHCSHAQNDDIVVAIVDDEEATLKYYERRNGRHVLKPANDALEPKTYDTLEIRGRVIGVVRRY